MTTMTKQQRKSAMEAVLKQNRSALSFVGVGFVALLAVLFMAYEQTRVPTGLAAEQAFDRLFEAGADNRVFTSEAQVRTLRSFKALEGVTCAVHIERRKDQAYDYDCVATLTDASGCLAFYPFYVEESSIGAISRPVTDDSARTILKRFRVTGTQSC